MFKKILLATDGSPHAEEALKYARGLASRDDAQVVVVHAVPPAPAYWRESEWQDLISRKFVEGEQGAGQAAEDLRDAGVDVIVEVLEGPPADADNLMPSHGFFLSLSTCQSPRVAQTPTQP